MTFSFVRSFAQETFRCTLVGLARFERAISWPPARRIDQAFPQPVELSILADIARLRPCNGDTPMYASI